MTVSIFFGGSPPFFCEKKERKEGAKGTALVPLESPTKVPAQEACRNHRAGNFPWENLGAAVQKVQPMAVKRPRGNIHSVSAKAASSRPAAQAGLEPEGFTRRPRHGCTGVKGAKPLASLCLLSSGKKVGARRGLSDKAVF